VQPILNGSGVIASKPLLDGYTITMRAHDVRRERTGIHAKVEILINDTVMAWTNFNIERDEDRTRIANSAYKHFREPLPQVYDKDLLKHDFDIFCSQVWEVVVASKVPEMVAGDPLLEKHFLLRPFVLEGGGSIMFAHPDKGKSVTALLMAVSIDAGINQLWPCEQRNVMFINLERSKESLQRRLGCVNHALGLAPDRPLLIQNERGKSLADIRESAAKAVKQYDIGFVILDSLSRAGLGDLNENRPGNLAVDVLNGLVPSWLAIGHSPRSTDEHLFGTIMMDAGADIMVRLASERKDNLLGTRMEITKANDIGERPMNTLAYEFDEQGLTRVRKAELNEFEQLTATEPVTNHEKIRRFLQYSPNARATTEEITATTELKGLPLRNALNNPEWFVKVFGAGIPPNSWAIKADDVAY
jgi:hypothetical protein